VPASEFEFVRQMESLERDLAAGRNVVLHCRQGIGRTGLVATCLLVASGHSASAAVEQLSAARGIAVPETLQQRQWIDHFAESLVGTK